MAAPSIAQRIAPHATVAHCKDVLRPHTAQYASLLAPYLIHLTVLFRPTGNPFYSITNDMPYLAAANALFLSASVLIKPSIPPLLISVAKLLL
jgi:hypothetical protein